MRVSVIISMELGAARCGTVSSCCTLITIAPTATRLLRTANRLSGMTWLEAVERARYEGSASYPFSPPLRPGRRHDQPAFG
jgi:hypothetical protein